MKRLLAAVLCLVLVCAAAARAAEPEQALWTRSEGDGDYETGAVALLIGSSEV